MMDRRESAALDRHITGNYGEDQLKPSWDDDPSMDGWDEPEPECQVSNCDELADDGVLCTMHGEQAAEAEMAREDG